MLCDICGEKHDKRRDMEWHRSCETCRSQNKNCKHKSKYAARLGFSTGNKDGVLCDICGDFYNERRDLEWHRSCETCRSKNKHCSHRSRYARLELVQAGKKRRSQGKGGVWRLQDHPSAAIIMRDIHSTITVIGFWVHLRAFGGSSEHAQVLVIATTNSQLPPSHHIKPRTKALEIASLRSCCLLFPLQDSV